ncbi:hypothetical protein HN51_001654, partial [Arachis hypogaea]
MAESLTCSPVSTLLQPSAPAPPQSSAFLRAPPLGLRNPLTYEHRGIVFLIIDSTESVIDIVSFFRFPPIGIHGLAHSVVQASGYDIDEGYLGSYQEEMLIMFQVESVEGVKNVGEILAVDGIDFIQMGSLDLSASMRSAAVEDRPFSKNDLLRVTGARTGTLVSSARHRRKLKRGANAKLMRKMMSRNEDDVKNDSDNDLGDDFDYQPNAEDEAEDDNVDSLDSTSKSKKFV